MTDRQWNQLPRVLRGEEIDAMSVGFIIDCPWLPNWRGRDIAEYLSSETCRFEANQRAVEAFTEVWFLPGLRSEFGMCAEPPAFPARCRLPRNESPFAEKLIHDVAQIPDLPVPDAAADGLLPFMLNRLRWAQPRLQAMGHKLRFSVQSILVNPPIAPFQTESAGNISGSELSASPLKHLHMKQIHCVPGDISR